jgi:hypothetical protein
MQVRFFDLVDSSIREIISGRSLLTEMPLPRLVFSPGLMIQMFAF